MIDWKLCQSKYNQFQIYNTKNQQTEPSRFRTPFCVCIQVHSPIQHTHTHTHTMGTKRQIKNGSTIQWKYGTAPAKVPPSIKVLLQLKAMFSFLFVWFMTRTLSGNAHCTRVWFQTKTFTAKLQCSRFVCSLVHSFAGSSICLLFVWNATILCLHY